MKLQHRPLLILPTLPVCGDCAHYRSNVTENQAGGVSGLNEYCAFRTDPDVVVWRDKPGCICHDKLSVQEVASTNNLLYDPPDINETLNATRNSITSLERIIGATVMSSLEEALTIKCAGDIHTIIENIGAVITLKLKQALPVYIEAALDIREEKIGRYIEKAIETLRQELTTDVQDNGETQ